MKDTKDQDNVHLTVSVNSTIDCEFCCDGQMPTYHLVVESSVKTSSMKASRHQPVSFKIHT